MEIKRNRTYILGIPRCQAYIFDSIFVDLIDGHIKTNIIRSGLTDIFHNPVISITAHLIMASPVTIEA